MGVRDGQSCESPLNAPDTCRAMPRPLCRGIASFSGCARGVWGGTPRHVFQGHKLTQIYCAGIQPGVFAPLL